MVIFFIFLLFFGSPKASRVLLLYEKAEMQLVSLFEEAQSADFQITKVSIDHNQEDESDQNSTFCQHLTSTGSFAAIADLTWGGWDAAKLISAEFGIPYIRIEVSNAPFMEAADNFLSKRDAMDVAMIFQSEKELDQSLYFIVMHYKIRVLVMSLDEPNKDPYERLRNLRPTPTAYAAFGTAADLSNLVNKASQEKLMTRNSRWNLFVEDFASPDLNIGASEVDIIVTSMKESDCCKLQALDSGCNCEPGTKPKQMVAKQSGKIISNAVKNLNDFNYRCQANIDNGNSQKLLDNVETEVGNLAYHVVGNTLEYPISLEIVKKSAKMQNPETIGTWNPVQKMQFSADFKNITLPKLFRVGMTPSKPWMYFELDPRTNEKLKDKNGNYIFQGYCVELLEMMSQRLKFDYEIVLSSNWQKSGYEYGKKLPDGTWSGLVGDLTSGNIDLVVADMTMTSEREEIIDYISPYFDQAGISIIVRKKFKEQSLFKFLQVLKLEVWLGILGAVLVTALLLWILDRFSPYSARNNKNGEQGRIFTLKESMWFALTSLTPQGGGEGPKAISGKVLVAAYWLFVVLMLATFTANLAAFLTVERMQTQLQSLEELAKQSRINYTVVKDTVYYDYFVNMAGAEEELYQKWKEISLNASENPAKYRVWDYPIREQYTHILQTIKETGVVDTAREGFNKVKDHLQGDFALINDAAQIRFEVFNDCDLIEIGEPFAEQPYALAVQQGSHLQEMLSRVILELQKDRYFETLQSKYWNTTKKNNCPVLDDSEGITLQSLGGVFIATLVGLVIAMITLAFEVYQQKKKQKNEIEDADVFNNQASKSKINTLSGYINHEGTLHGGSLQNYKRNLNSLPGVQ